VIARTLGLVTVNELLFFFDLLFFVFCLEFGSTAFSLRI
jgi:hypothetical protein